MSLRVFNMQSRTKVSISQSTDKLWFQTPIYTAKIPSGSDI